VSWNLNVMSAIVIVRLPTNAAPTPHAASALDLLAAPHAGLGPHDAGALDPLAAPDPGPETACVMIVVTPPPAMAAANLLQAETLPAMTAANPLQALVNPTPGRRAYSLPVFAHAPSGYTASD
jgi:hypothetical protein